MAVSMRCRAISVLLGAFITACGDGETGGAPGPANGGAGGSGGSSAGNGGANGAAGSAAGGGSSSGGSPSGGSSSGGTAAGAGGSMAGAAGSDAPGGSSGSGGEGADAGTTGHSGAAGAGADNQPPLPPVINEPAVDGQLVSGSDVHMETSPMSDPDEGDEHRCTDWEIWSLEPDERVWSTLCIEGLEGVHTHLGDGAFEGSLEGELELDPDTEYQLRVRHRDDSGNPATEWSSFSVRDFVTTPELSALPGAPGWLAMQPGFKVQEVASGFRLPVNIAFVPNASLHSSDPLFYVTELYGTIKVVTTDGTVGVYRDGLLDYTPSGLFPGSGEQGLAGIVVDPVSGDVFAAMLYDAGGPHYPMVVRLSSADGGFSASSMSVLLDMPGEEQGQSHFISNLTLGPDGKLYVHMGDGFVSETALDLDSFRGKILRLNLDGSAPPDNPFYDADNGITARDYVWVYGVRNPFGGVWRNTDDSHFVVENGPSIDRFLRAEAGHSYGWAGSDADMLTDALYNWTPASGPVNVAFIEPELWAGSGFPADKQGHVFVSESGPTWATGPQAQGKRISELVLGASDQVLGDPTPLVQYNGTGKATIAGLAAGPDGLYFTSLYRDTGYSGPTDAGASVYRVAYSAPPEHGITGEYYENDDFTGARLVRQDANIAFNWFARAPAPGMDADEFSVRFSGELHPEFSETYTFTVSADDRARLWVNGVLVVDRWAGSGPTSGSIALTADEHVPLVLEYAEDGGYARVILSWESPSLPAQIVPSERLHPAAE